MRNFVALLLVTCALSPAAVSPAPAQGPELTGPPTAAAAELVRKGVELAEHDKPEQAVEALREAVAAAPHSVTARSEYVRVMSYFMGQREQVRKEYEALMSKEPHNPVYPLALAMGLTFAPEEMKRGWLEKAAQASPEGWVWGHYARARLSERKEPEAALAEALKAVEKDPVHLQS